ncbi:MAG TPA: SGNH/GDSL hydrolase family protein [Polyangiaceae bacterium]
MTDADLPRMQLGRSVARHGRGLGSAVVALAVAFSSACSDKAEPPGSSSGGSPAGGAAGVSGTATGGSATGGTATGGTATGGAGGAATGGAGGSATSGAGGSTTGGTAAGGTTAGAAGSSGAGAGAPAGGAGGAGASSGGATSGSGGSVTGGASGAGGAPSGGWVGTWATAQQLTEMTNLPPSPGLSNNTLRQVVYVSIGGTRVRVKFSNQYGNAPLTMSAVHLANSTMTHSIGAGSSRALTFSGTPSVTVPAGMTVTSDPVDFALTAQTKVAITIAFGSTPSDVTGHPGSRTTSFIQTGNAVNAASFTSPVTTEHWYYITGIDVEAPATSRAVVTIGDSITDGRGSTTDANNRWPDNLSRRLRSNAATASVGVLNQGIGGNAVVSGGLGPTGVSRFQRDVLDQPGVRWVVVLHGVNDIGVAMNQDVVQALIGAYQGFVTAARARGVRIYGVPILPFGGSSYDTPAHEEARQAVNTWIRGAGNFDAVIDLDAAVRDPMAPARLLGTYDSGDRLHLNVAGYQRMADAIDLALFAP